MSKECPKCNADIVDENRFCGKCGYKFEDIKEIINKTELPENILEQEDDHNPIISRIKFKTKNKLSKTKEIAKLFFNYTKNNKRKISLIVVIIILVSSISAYLNSPLKKIQRFCDQDLYYQAKTLYSSTMDKSNNNEKEKLDEALKEYFGSKIKNIEHDFLYDKIDFDTASKELNNIKIFWIADGLVKISEEKISKLNESQISYQKGLDYINNNDEPKGVYELSKVIQEDLNYTSARNEINNVLPIVKQEKLEEAETYFQNKEYQKALDSVIFLSEYFEEDVDIKNKLILYKTSKERADEEERLKMEQRKKELIALTNRHVDSVTKVVTYTPKPYGSLINIPRGGVIFYPYLRGELGSDVLKLIAGFNRQDWIFMESIICNADGYVFTINFDYFDRKSEVGFGSGVYEWIEIASFDTIDNAQQYGLNDNNPRLLENLKKLANSNSALVKFKGDTYAFDYALTSTQKESIRNIIDLHSFRKPNDANDHL